MTVSGEAAAPDTSVVVAGLASWHPDHEVARAFLGGRPMAIGHVLVEAYSVLTRLPAPRRISTEVAWAALAHAFPRRPVALAPARLRELLASLSVAGIGGGVVYDAVVAATARQHGLALVSLDRRAMSAYATVGVEVRFLA